MFPSAAFPPLSALHRPFFSVLGSAPDPYIKTPVLKVCGGVSAILSPKNSPPRRLSSDSANLVEGLAVRNAFRNDSETEV